MVGFHWAQPPAQPSMFYDMWIIVWSYKSTMCGGQGWMSRANIPFTQLRIWRDHHRPNVQLEASPNQTWYPHQGGTGWTRAEALPHHESHPHGDAQCHGDDCSLGTGSLTIWIFAVLFCWRWHQRLYQPKWVSLWVLGWVERRKGPDLEGQQ